MKNPLTRSIFAPRPSRFASLFAVLFSLAFLPAAHAVGGVSPSPAVLQFPATAVGSVSTAITETVTISGITGPFNASLHYSTDYSLTGFNCTGTPTYTCVATVTFRPTLPGARKDALFIANSSGRVATVLIGGISNAPMGALQGGVLENSSPIASLGAGDYSAPVTDEKHVVYFFYNNNLYSSTYLNGPVLLKANATSGDVYDLAIDGAGVLYWGSGTSSTASTTLNTYDTVQNISGTFTLPASDVYFGTATDVAGNIFALGTNTRLHLQSDSYRHNHHHGNQPGRNRIQSCHHRPRRRSLLRRRHDQRTDRRRNADSGERAVD